MRDRLVYRTIRARFRSRDAGPWQILDINAGVPHIETIVPDIPNGDLYTREVARYPVNVQVAVSPSGRSVRVHVNGVEVDVVKR